MLQENPPLPEEAQDLVQSQPTKKVKIVAEEEIKIGTEKVEDVLVQAPKIME